MNDLNLCNFICRAGKDPELRFTNSGTAVATFTAAVGRKYKDTDETTWLNIIVWGKLAESVVAKYVTKGKQLFVSGRLQNRSYQDRDGNTRYMTEIVAENIQLLGGSEAKRQEPHQETWDDTPF